MGFRKDEAESFGVQYLEASPSPEPDMPTLSEYRVANNHESRTSPTAGMRLEQTDPRLGLPDGFGDWYMPLNIDADTRADLDEIMADIEAIPDSIMNSATASMVFGKIDALEAERLKSLEIQREMRRRLQVDEKRKLEVERKRLVLRRAEIEARLGELGVKVPAIQSMLAVPAGTYVSAGTA